MSEFRCPKAGCGKTFPTDNQMQGHIGGAHARKRPSQAPIKHGTHQGYREHQRRGKMPACRKCLKAWAAYIREYTRRVEANGGQPLRDTK